MQNTTNATVRVQPSDRSLFQIDSTWTTDESKEIKLAAFQGQPVVVTMFFTHCEYACPALVHDVRKIEQALPPNLPSKVQFVLVSFDTARDTPAVLAEFRKVHELSDRWSLLRGSNDDVLELSALLGVNFKKDARGQFSHSNLITVLNPQGEIVHQQTGLNQDPTETVRNIVSLFQP